MRDIVAVIGTTGVGKSDLAVSLAQRIKARHADSPSATSSVPSDLDTTTSESPERQNQAGTSRYRDAMILSADSMQLYKGLDVITNKMTRDEMGGVDHWGLDVVMTGEPSWELGRWCTEADRQVRRLDVFNLAAHLTAYTIFNQA
jgi:tRNA A37 N6-isopentenylltransferase MiaA